MNDSFGSGTTWSGVSAGSEPLRTSKPAQRSACSHCRRVKMRCDRTDSSPCSRCRKAKRPCVVAVSGQVPYALGSPINGSGLVSTRLEHKPASTPSQEWPNAGSRGSPRTLLTHTPPRSVNLEPSMNHGIDNGSEELSSGKQFRSPLSTINGQINPTEHQVHIRDDRSDKEYLSTRDVRELLAIFKARLLRFIPILQDTDFSHLEDLSEVHSHLAYCICYVTSRIVPGYRHTRTKLFPLMENIVNDGFKIDGKEKYQINHFHSLIILYTFTEGDPLPWNGHPTEKNDVSFWKVKSATENLGAQIALHQSPRGSNSVARESLVTANSGMRIKLHGLWLYSKSHHVSIMTGTSPTIRADSTIHQSCSSLKAHLVHPEVARLVAEAELCLVWERVNFHPNTLGEWWCSSESFHETHSEPSKFIDQIRILLDRWKEDWSEQLNGPFANVLTLHFHYSRFCLNTYYFRNSTHSTTEWSIHETNTLMQCVTAAAELLSLMLDCGPLAMEELKDCGSLVFLMFGFSCFFILQAKQHRRSLDLARELQLVRSSARFMMDLAKDVNESSHLCGKSILHHLNMITNDNSDLDKSGNQRVATNSVCFRDEYNTNSELGLQSVSQYETRKD